MQLQVWIVSKWHLKYTDEIQGFKICNHFEVKAAHFCLLYGHQCHSICSRCQSCQRSACGCQAEFGFALLWLLLAVTVGKLAFTQICFFFMWHHKQEREQQKAFGHLVLTQGCDRQDVKLSCLFVLYFKQFMKAIFGCQDQ